MRLTFNFGPDGRRAELGELTREDKLVNRLLDERKPREAVVRTPTSELPDVGVGTSKEIDAAFPPLNLPPPPNRRVLSSEHSPGYVDPPID